VVGRPGRRAAGLRRGTFIGYRGHDAGRAPAPLFWFGHGLGYTTWEYGPAEASGPGPNPTVQISVTNTGRRTGREVVQVYLRPADPDQPVRLVGWRGVTAEPGEEVIVDVPTDARMWRRWDVAASTWAQLPAGGRLLVARGLGDVRAVVELGS
jgi:beta-glucosidase